MTYENADSEELSNIIDELKEKINKQEKQITALNVIIQGMTGHFEIDEDIKGIYYDAFLERLNDKTDVMFAKAKKMV